MAFCTPEKVEELRRLCGPKVDEQLRKGGEDGLDDATLKRWIVARKGDVKDAAKDLSAHAVWRAAYVPRGYIPACEIREELEQRKSFLPGYDKAGRPLCLVVVQNHFPRNPEKTKRFIAYCLDCTALMGKKQPGWDGKASGIFDLRNLKMSNLDVAALRNVFDLLQNHYPERLHKMWLYCAPTIFYGIWKMVYPFIDPVTREKVRFVFEKDAEEDFRAEFDASVLPPELQSWGTGRLITAEEQYERLRGPESALSSDVSRGKEADVQQQQAEEAARVGPQTVEVVA